MSVNKVNSDGSTTLISGSTLWADSPIGSILPYGGATAPSGWMLCQGQAISRTIYSELFTVIGTSFGSGDGSTTFNLPDLREATTKGVGLTSKSNNHYDADGLALGEFIDDRVQSHTHDLVDVHQSGSTIGWGVFNSNVLDAHTATNPNSGRSGATTEVKAVGVNYIIKAKMVAMPSDFMSKVDEAVEEAIIYEKITATVTNGVFSVNTKTGYNLVSVTPEYDSAHSYSTQSVSIQTNHQTHETNYYIYVRTSDGSIPANDDYEYHLVWLKQS